MTSDFEARGVIAAIITPFSDEDDVDEPGLEKLTEYLVKGGVHGIMTSGGTGEFPHLLREERKRVTEVVARVARGKIPVFAGTAACSTKETILLSQDAQKAGANAVIITAPYYFGLPDESLYEHFKTIAREIELPVVLYNNPLYTGNNLSPQLIRRLSEIAGIVGLKQSNSDLGQLVEAIRQAGEKLSILTGIDSQFYATLCVGGKGIFSTAACVIPQQMVALYDAVQKGSHHKALTLHMKLQRLNKFLEYDPGYVAPCKEALRTLGLPAGRVRMPLPELTSQEKDDIQKALQDLGISG